MWYKHARVNETSDNLPNLWFKDSLSECFANVFPSQLQFGELNLCFMPANFHVRVCWESSNVWDPSQSVGLTRSQLASVFVPVRVVDELTEHSRTVTHCVGSFPLPLSTGSIVYSHIPRAFILKSMKRMGFDYKADLDNNHRLRLKFPGLGEMVFFCDLLDTLGTVWTGVALTSLNKSTQKLQRSQLGLSEFLRLQGIHVNQIAYHSKYAHYFVQCIFGPNSFAYPFWGSLTTRGSRSRSKGVRGQAIPLKATLPAQPTNQIQGRISSDKNSAALYYSRYDLLRVLDVFFDSIVGGRSSINTDHMGHRIVSTWNFALLECIQSVMSQVFSTGDLLVSEPDPSGSQTTCDTDQELPESLTKAFKTMNQKVMDGIYEILTVNPLSQYLDQTNVLAEYVHLHKLSSKALGGSSPTALLRDVAPSSFGKLCSLYTIDGENAGTVNQYASLARGSQGGELKTIVRLAPRGSCHTDRVALVNTIELEETPVSIHPLIWRRSEVSVLPRAVVQERNEFKTREIAKVSLFCPDSTGFLAPQVNLIPFLWHDDPTRCLMGANMQRQAVSLLSAQKSVVSTGMDTLLSSLNGNGLHSLTEGVVTCVTQSAIYMRDSFNRELRYLFPFTISNQKQIRHYYPVVWEGERVFPGQLLAQNQGVHEGELCLGQNLFVAYASWYGYTYEDAILLNERLVYERTLTSVSMAQKDVMLEEHEEITSFLPGVDSKDLCLLNQVGIAPLGSLVEREMAIIGKVGFNYRSIAQYETSALLSKPLTALLTVLLGYDPKLMFSNASALGDRSFSGTLLYFALLLVKDAQLGLDDLPVFRCVLGKFRHIEAGDKLCGRHGNKGVVSAIWPQADFPYTTDGLIPDILVSPLGVPSRMNVGQILETLFGLTGFFSDSRCKVNVSAENDYEIRHKRNVLYHKLNSVQEYSNYKTLFNPFVPGKVLLRDGRTSRAVLGGSVLGLSYIFKLTHMVQDKITARSQGVYAEITQQPVRGKWKLGGQRFGEMEAWAMEAFGAAYELRDLLTLKSDATGYRDIAYETIFFDQLNPRSCEMGFPECWHVLVKHLNSLGIETYT